MWHRAQNSHIVHLPSSEKSQSQASRQCDLHKLAFAFFLHYLHLQVPSFPFSNITQISTNIHTYVDGNPMAIIVNKHKTHSCSLIRINNIFYLWFCLIENVEPHTHARTMIIIIIIISSFYYLFMYLFTLTLGCPPADASGGRGALCRCPSSRPCGEAASTPSAR